MTTRPKPSDTRLRPFTSDETRGLSLRCPIDLLPRRVLSFDIETAITKLRKPEQSTLAVAGCVVYTRYGKTAYRAGAFRHFANEQIHELHALLDGFDGLILGHNLFDFDFRVLRTQIDFSRIIGKTLDLMFFLRSLDAQRRSRLDLARLARLNLKKRKLLGDEDISQLWRDGERDKVLRRNRRDCELVAELWMKLVREGQIRTKLRFAGAGESDDAMVRMSSDRFAVLAGREPLMAWNEWTERLEKWGSARGDPKWGGKTVIEEPVPDGAFVLFHRFICGGCDRHFVLAASFHRQFARDESIACPFCKVPVLVSGRDTLTTGGLYGLWAPRHYCERFPPERFPSIELARRLIRQMRFWRY
jgi:hypothetical protein